MNTARRSGRSRAAPNPTLSGIVAWSSSAMDEAARPDMVAGPAELTARLRTDGSDAWV
jgi:hypothetical protein